MKYSTQELYNMCPSKFKDLPYTEALNKKVNGAIYSMAKYGRLAKKNMGNSEVYIGYLKQYEASEEARDHNRKLLEEIKQEEDNELENYEREGRTLPNQRTDDIGIQREGSDKGICKYIPKWLQRYI